jgi:FMN reductase [NAD(P)H]
MVSYLEQINRSEEVNWSKNTSSVYQSVYFPNVITTLKDQGFTHKK